MKRRQKTKKSLLQVFVPPELERRFYASPEFKLHGKIGTALRAILDRVLPRDGENQE